LSSAKPRLQKRSAKCSLIHGQTDDLSYNIARDPFEVHDQQMQLNEGATTMQEDLRSLIPDLSRRQFVVTSLAAGFALAVRPVSADTITTDAKGLEAGEVKIPVKYEDKEGDMPAYRAMPDKGGPFPVVLVVEEIFGVHEHIKDVCRRFAKLGYLAIAPEMYSREGDVSKMDWLNGHLLIVQLGNELSGVAKILFKQRGSNLQHEPLHCGFGMGLLIWR
jgi:hypothetical protein